MKKLKVAVDSLKVDTFVIDTAEKDGGTVYGQMTAAGGACCTREGTGCHTVNFTTPCNNC
jgi:hypothetical protein